MEQRLNFYSSAPEAIESMVNLEKYIRTSTLPKSLMELVRLRASQINGCAYCVDLHTSDARKTGEDERRLAAVVVWRETPFFSERERAALEWTESLTLIAQTHAPDEIWEQLKVHFTAKELVDLTLLIGTINTWNRIAIAFRKMPE
ncbi:carboxymuconolactone decarboxylase family protein [Tolumonas lignilytica]|uniref:carboxymuconolactone decarboxylase family protein n=1 Tax=Tolumonas lignilytica TaxID=1283284 RepID=UPI000465315A|nr:carboxymuconolactone decarboxylase family protein [Tolumonas lignilytica]